MARLSTCLPAYLPNVKFNLFPFISRVKIIRLSPLPEVEACNFLCLKL